MITIRVLIALVLAGGINAQCVRAPGGRRLQSTPGAASCGSYLDVMFVVDESASIGNSPYQFAKAVSSGAFLSGVGP